MVEDAGYWAGLAERYASTLVSRGFLPTEQLQDELGRCRALLMTPKWIEAYGNVVAEALACGVPVVTYRRGGPAELVEDGVSGFVVRARLGGGAGRRDRPGARAGPAGPAGAGPRPCARSRRSRERLETWLAPLLAA